MDSFSTGIAIPTGIATLDARLGGGFPRGRLSEICGPPSSGRTALAQNLLATHLRDGGLSAWIDLADAFDPISAAAAAIDLDRLLWVRPRSLKEALQSCDRLLQTEGFELVVFDCVVSGEGSGRTQGTRPITNAHKPTVTDAYTVTDVTWLRLARLAAKTQTALVALSQSSSRGRNQHKEEEYPGNVSATGSRAEVVLEMLPLGARFSDAPSLLEAIETTAVLKRHRVRPTGSEVALSVAAFGETEFAHES